MTHASALEPRRSSEFWAIVGSAIAIGALILTVSGWQRSDIRELRGDIRGVDSNLRGEIATLETNLRGEIATLEINLRGEIATLETNLRSEIVTLGTNLRGEIATLETNLRGELQTVEEKLSSKIESLQEGQALIGARLAVVESHVLGASSLARSGTGSEVVP